MARNLGHALADHTANETKTSYNTSNYRVFNVKTDLKSQLPPQSNAKDKLFTGIQQAQNEIHKIRRKL